MILNLNISAILCFIGGCFSFYILFRYLHVASSKVITRACDALPVLLGALAWTTAGIEFLDAVNHVDSQIIIQRGAMVVAWCWLIYNYSNNCRRGKK